MQKPAYLSKTLWVNLAMAVAAFFPGVPEYIASNPEVPVLVIAGVNMVLRIFTKDKIALK